MTSHDRRIPLAGITVLALIFALGSGCWNGSHVRYEANADHGRFELVIEADRTRVEGSHFLLDTATGDVWRLESGDGKSGSWARLGDAPDDVTVLHPPEDEEAEQDG